MSSKTLLDAYGLSNQLKDDLNQTMKIVLEMKITLQGSSGSPQVHLSAKSEFFPQLLFAAPEDCEQFIFYH